MSNLNDIASHLDVEGVLAQLLHAGPIVGLLLLLSIAALTVTLLKAGQFLMLGVGRPSRLLDAAITGWRAGDHRAAAREVHRLTGRRADLVLAAMSAGHDMRPIALVREDIEAEATAHLAGLRANLRILEATSQLAPLIGLFGTVIGMMTAFQALQSAGTEADPAALAGGIWTALVTTAVGLAIAIPAALALYWFEGRLAREQTLIETAVTRVLTAPPPSDEAALPSSIGIADAAE